MPEFWSIVGLKIRKFPKESWDLCDNPKEVVRGRMIMHLKSFNGLVVLNDRIEWPLFKFLPISAKIVLGVGIEQKKEILNIWDYLL